MKSSQIISVTTYLFQPPALMELSSAICLLQGIVIIMFMGGLLCYSKQLCDFDCSLLQTISYQIIWFIIQIIWFIVIIKLFGL